MTSGIDVEEGTPGYYKAIEHKKQSIIDIKDYKDGDPIPAENQVIIPIGRAMGKVTVTIPGGEMTAVDKSNVTLGKINNAVYSVANNPVSMYHFPYFGTLQRFQTPHFNFYDETTVPDSYWPALHADDFGDFTAYGEYGSAAGQRYTAYGYKSVMTTNLNVSPQQLTPSAFYVMENTNLHPTYGNTTMAQVKATFVPSEWEDTGLEAGSNTFYRIWHTDLPTGPAFVKKAKTGFWGTQAAADAYVTTLNDAATAAAGAPVTVAYAKEYTDGVCYYMIPLRNTYFSDQQTNNDPIVYSIMRNHYYDVTVTKVTDCGYTKPGGKDPEPGPGDETDPEDPLDPNAVPMIEVSIQVKPWIWVKQGEEIGIRD